MPREIVSVNHRYVRTLLNALVLQCGTAARAEEVLQGAWEPSMKPEDKDRLLAELQKLQSHPLVQTIKPKAEVILRSEPAPVDPLEAVMSAPPSYIVGDVNDVLSELLGGTRQPQPPHPLMEELRKYAEAAIRFFQEKKYLRTPLDHEKVVEIQGEKYVLMYTAVLRKGSVSINLNGTSGSAKKLLDLDDSYLAMMGSRKCFEVDVALEDYHSAVFMAFAAKLVPGRNYRFWVSHREGSDSKDLLKIHTSMSERGCVVDNTTVSLKISGAEYQQIFR